MVYDVSRFHGLSANDAYNEPDVTLHPRDSSSAAGPTWIAPGIQVAERFSPLSSCCGCDRTASFSHQRGSKNLAFAKMESGKPHREQTSTWDLLRKGQAIARVDNPNPGYCGLITAAEC
jgi:hypothetical protein